MTRVDTDYTLQQKDIIEYPIIAIATDNVPHRQQHTYVHYLTIVQLAQTNKKINRTDTYCAPQQTGNSDCTIITATECNTTPRTQHMDMIYLSIIKLVQTKKNE